MATFSDAQVAAYIRDNNLDSTGIANAANVFGLSQDQIGRAQGLLSSGSSAVNDASNAYSSAVSANPNLDAQNRAFYDAGTNTGWALQSPAYGTANPDYSGANYVAPPEYYNAASQTPTVAPSYVYDPTPQTPVSQADQAQQSLMSALPQGSYNALMAGINGLKSGTTSVDDFGKTVSQYNLSGQQLSQLVNQGLGKNYTADQAVSWARNFLPQGTQVGGNNDYIYGYGGYQPAGSPFAGDSPMPKEYMDKLPQFTASTQNAVNYALQQAIEQQRRNGYDPEKSYAVQTLRGFYSNDPQAKMQALQYAISSAKQANPNAYITSDYGFPAIIGFDQQVETPTFKTAYDPNWNRPTLYDMINSAYGWTEKNNNFADPAKRDANLNRRLTDAEIRAFQSGQLTPQLLAEVSRYRGASGGSGPVTNPASTGSGAGGSGGSNLLGIGNGTQGSVSTNAASGAFGAPSTGINLSQLQNPTQWDVGTNQTVAGQLASIISSDSPLMQQARARALQSMSGRGLVNSSLATSAADSALYDVAMQIAQQDAGTYADSARYNADSSNTFSRDNNAFTRDAFMADFNLAANNWLAEQNFKREYQMLDKTQQQELERMAVANGFQTARDQYMNQWSVAKDNYLNQFQIDRDAATQNYQKELERIRQQYSTSQESTGVQQQRLDKARSDISNANAEYAKMVNSVYTSGMTPEAMDSAIEDLAKSYNQIIKSAAQVLGWKFEDWDIEVTPRAPAPASSAAPAPATEGNT